MVDLSSAALPTDNPLWEAQVALEMGMAETGRNRVRNSVTKAVEKGRRTTLKPYQELLQAWLPKVADAITEFTNGWAGKRGMRPRALEPLKQCDPFVAGLIGLRSILDQLGTKATEVTSLSIRIGGLIEHELQVKLWEKTEPALYRAVKKRLKSQAADHTHTARVNINTFNKLLAEGKFAEGWEDWPVDLKLNVGAEVLNAIIRGTGWFKLERGLNASRPDTTHLTLAPGMEEWVANRLTKLEEVSPALKPTIIPPKPWCGMADGGYWTPYVPQQTLIYFKASQVQQRAGARQEFDALDMPDVYRALNFLQATPWRVHKRVLAVIQEFVNRGVYGVGELPATQPRDVPPKPADIETNEVARANWKREASAAINFNSRLFSGKIAFERVMSLAEEFADHERIYFPHKLDWRGRMYPLPSGLQPQGSDIARGLLEFAQGKPVTEKNQGDAWLAINLTSAWGNDKISFDERIAWVHSREDLWRRIAADPFGTQEEWLGTADKPIADKPWSFLAACFDWVGFLEEGFGYVSHAPVAVDGTCNGLQHLSALGRDATVGERVNLVPGERPSDVYRYVGDELLPDLLRIAEVRGEQGDHAAFWLSFRDGEGRLPRALTKRPVMILAYSATREAFKKYTLEFLEERNMLPPQWDKEAWKLCYQRVNFIVGLMWDTIQAAVPLAMRVMQWLKDCAKQAAVGNQPIYWRTPDGFICRHFYGVMQSKQVKQKLDGYTYQLRLEEPTKDLDVSKQLLGISPNFVHSLDGTAARGCIRRCEDGGEITSFASIHDSFGTHAADMWALYGHLREAFVEVHEAGVLENFRAMCQGVIVGHLLAERPDLDVLEASQIADERLPPLPELGSLDIRAVLESDYFFA